MHEIHSKSNSSDLQIDSYPKLSVIQQSVSFSRIYGLINERMHGCKIDNCDVWGGGIPSCHGSAAGKVNDKGEYIEGCHYRCCEIDPRKQGNTIIIEQGELDCDTKKKDHLKMYREYLGVQLYECLTGICNSLYDLKPKDCKRYPFLPVLTEDGWLRFKHGLREKCPMADIDRILHLASVIMDVVDSIIKNPQSKNSLMRGHEVMVNYEDYPIDFIEKLSLTEMDELAEKHILLEAMQEKERIRAENLQVEETKKNAWLQKYIDDMRAMKKRNLQIYENLREIGVHFSEKGIDTTSSPFIKLLSRL